jgi:PspA-Associated protein
VIVRLMTEGQYRVSDEVAAQLNQLDDRAVQALDADDEAELDARLEEMWALVQKQGERLADDELFPSDVIIPPSDLTLEETKALFSGNGLIPDIPAP